MTKYRALSGPSSPFVLVVGFLLVSIHGGCGANEAAGACSSSACEDGGAVIDAAQGSQLGLLDGASPTVQSGPLQVSITARGTTRTCGDCAVITAVPNGGSAPYTFVWSDDQLSGPGPHELCDETSSSYSVEVSDSAGPLLDNTSSGAVGQARAHVDLPCTPPSVDEEAGFSGCKLLLNASIFTLLDPDAARVASIYSCSALDGGPGISAASQADAGSGAPIPLAQYIALPEPMLGNHGYTLRMDLLLALQIGGRQRLELWGSKEGCSLDEKLGEMVFTGEQSVSTCVTPQSSYDKLLIRPAEDSVNPDFAISFGVSMTLCSDCAKP